VLSTLSRSEVTAACKPRAWIPSGCRPRQRDDDEEVHKLAGQIDTAPAGAHTSGWVWAAVVIVIAVIIYYNWNSDRPAGRSVPKRPRNRGRFFSGRGLERLRTDHPADRRLAHRLAADLPPKVELTEVPFSRRRTTSAARPAGHLPGQFQGPVTAEDLRDKVYLPGAAAACRWRCSRGARLRHGLVQACAQLPGRVARSRGSTPVIVLQDYGVWPIPIYHYAWCRLRPRQGRR